MDVPGVGAVGQDVGNIAIGIRRFLDAPVHMQLEVAELTLQPEALVSRGLALGIVVDGTVHDLPVPAIPLRHLPPGEVVPVEKRSVAGVAARCRQPGPRCRGSKPAKPPSPGGRITVPGD